MFVGVVGFLLLGEAVRSHAPTFGMVVDYLRLVAFINLGNGQQYADL